MREVMKVGFLGIAGSYTHQAAVECFPEQTHLGQKSLKDVFDALLDGAVDLAVVPVENSTAGRVAEVYSLLLRDGFFIIAEYLLPIHHCLLVPAKNGVSGSDIRSVAASISNIHSHPQALMQCSGFIERYLPDAMERAALDTASAAQFVACEGKGAAIASRHAAHIHNLAVVAENIEDNPQNVTRFLILARKPVEASQLQGAVVTTLLFQVGHQPGALLAALQPFANRGVNLTKLETYMLGTERPDPAFYVDLGSASFGQNVQDALSEFMGRTTKCRVLGSYCASPLRGMGAGFLPV